MDDDIVQNTGRTKPLVEENERAETREPVEEPKLNYREKRVLLCNTTGKRRRYLKDLRVETQVSSPKRRKEEVISYIYDKR